MPFKIKFYNKVSDRLAKELDKHRNRTNSGMAAQLQYDLAYLKAAVAYDDKTVVGWAGISIRKFSSEINLYVDGKYRESGIGGELLDTLLVNVADKVENIPIECAREPIWVGKMYRKYFKKYKLTPASVNRFAG